MPQQPAGKAGWRLPGWRVNANTGRLTAVAVDEPLQVKFFNKCRQLHGNSSNQPGRIGVILRNRDSRLLSMHGQQAIDELKLAYNTRGSIPHKGVYIWLHPTHGGSYVGSWFRSEASSMFNRTCSHLQSANILCRSRAECMQDYTGNKEYERKHPKLLYLHLIRDGLLPWYVFPLQLLPNIFTDAQVLACEQQWIDFFHTKYPAGFNLVNASATHAGITPPLGVGRWYASRDVCRRIHACWSAYIKYRLSADNYHSFFTRYATKTLVRIHCFCASGRDPHGVDSAALLLQWHIPEWFTAQLSTWLASILNVRYPRPAAGAATRRHKKVIVTDYTSPVYDQISLSAALNSPEVQECMPDTFKQYLIDHGVPSWGFRYTKPVGLLMCNYPTIARHLDTITARKLTIGDPLEQPCICERPDTQPWLQQHGFIPDSYQHVITCSSGILQGAPAGLVQLFEQGYEHRAHQLSTTMSDAVKSGIVDNVRCGLQRFVHDTRSVHSYQGSMYQMIHRACAHLSQQLTDTKFANGVVISNNSKPHEPGTVFTPWCDSYKQHIDNLHSDFVVTTADKLSNNYVVVCKKLFVSVILEDLNSGQFYARVLSQGNQTVIDKVAAELSQAAIRLAKLMYGASTLADMSQHMRVLPYAAALVKLHKSPVQFRFLACSNQNSSKPVALWLTALFSAVHQCLVDGWKRLLTDLKVLWKHLPPWSASRSVQIVNLVKHFNKLCVSVPEFIRGGGWLGFDVERLYTNIPQDGPEGLVSVLAKVLGEFVWDTHSVSRNSPRSRLLKVYKDRAYGAEWLDVDITLQDVADTAGDYTPSRKHGMHNARWGVDKDKKDFFLFDWKTAVRAVKFLVQFSFVQFGSQVWHQQTGIPMGINPAVYMANYYLFYHEYQFLHQFKLLLVAHPPVPGGSLEALQLFECNTEGETPVWVDQWPVAVHARYKGNIVAYILDKFQLMGRFVDDVTSGPNQFLPYLLNQKDTLLGGLIRGIYPDCLVLKRTVADMWSFPTLDIRIKSATLQHEDTDGDVLEYVTSFTVLYDKRREECYDGIPVVQYSHVSSSISSRSSSGILMGQLHRYRELVMIREYYVLECALLLHRLIARGHHHRVLFAKLKRHVRMYPDTFGDTHYMSLLKAIKLKFTDDRLPALCATGVRVPLEPYL